MSERAPWDWPPEPCRRSPVQEILPPGPQARVHVTLQRHRSGPPSWLNPTLLVVLPLILLFMFPMGFVMLLALLGLLDGGWQTAQLVVLAITVLVVAVWRWSHGRPF